MMIMVHADLSPWSEDLSFGKSGCRGFHWQLGDPSDTEGGGNPGVYSCDSQQLTWSDINVVEVVSTRRS
jgi:hypothetical protein